MAISFISSLRRAGFGLALATCLPLIAGAEEEKPAAASEASPAATEESPAAEVPKLTPEQEKLMAILQKASTAYYSQNYTDALTQLDEAVKLDPNDAQIQMMRGGCFAELGRFDEAKAVFEEMAKKTPKHFAVRFNLVELHNMQKRYAEAREGFEGLLKDFPESEFVRYKIVLTYLAEKNQQGAIEWFQKMRPAGETPELSYAAAALAISQGKFTLSQQLLLEAEQRTPGALRHLYDSLAAIDFVLRADYPPRAPLIPTTDAEAKATPDSVLEDGSAKTDDEQPVHP